MQSIKISFYLLSDLALLLLLVYIYVMSRRKKLTVNKTALKKMQGKCCFCDVTDYSCLHVHRIVYGEHGGKYHCNNCISVCSNCHAKIHDGQIVIDKKYKSSLGKSVLHYWEGGLEKWLTLEIDIT